MSSTEIEIVTTETERKKRRSLGKVKLITDEPKTQSKSQSKKGVKDYKDYVYVGQEGVDTTTLVPLLQEDYDYNAKLHEVLEVGKEYTYKKLCELLEETYHKGGNGKQIQLATWYQHLEWEHPINPNTKKPSKKMLITKIYDTPRQKINQTYELSNFKEQQLECNFIFSILNNKNLHEEVSDFGLITGVRARDMYCGIGLVNKDYHLVRSNKGAITDFLPIENLIETFSCVDNYTRQFTLGTLNRLTRSKVIVSYAYTYIWTDTNKKEHLATDKELLAIENGVKEMVTYAQDNGYNVDSIADLYNGKLKDFQSKDLQAHMLKLIREEIPTIEYFSRAYKLVYLKSKMKDYLIKLASEMGITLEELQQIKLHDSLKEHTDFQIGKAMKRNNDQPLTQEKEVSLLNAIINNTNLYPLTDQERKLEEDRKFIMDRATISNYIDSLSASGDIDKIYKMLYEDTIEKHEEEYLNKLLEDAISYSNVPLTLDKVNNSNIDKQVEFADLNKFIDKFENIKSFYLECMYSIKNKLYVTLHINHTKGHGRADKIDLVLDDMYNLKKLQVYLIISYNLEVKVGQRNKR